MSPGVFPRGHSCDLSDAGNREELASRRATDPVTRSCDLSDAGNREELASRRATDPITRSCDLSEFAHAPSGGPGGGGSVRRGRVVDGVAGLWRRVREGYWAIPAICVLGAAAVASALVQIDRGLQQRGFALVFAGGPDSARSLLSTISTSMLSLTALTFSITMVVLQLASSQFSPRAMATFLQDRQNQLTLGVFLATYVYALLALREIRGTEAPVDQFVPGLTIGTAFVLVLVSIGFFVAYSTTSPVRSR
jgi:hypothetical protein